MESITVLIRNKKGLHARAAAKFVGVAGHYDANVTVSRCVPDLQHANACEQLEVNGGSILGLMMLAAEPGAEIVIAADGPQASEALQALRELVDNKFGEEA